MRYYYRPNSPHADQHGFVEERYSNDGSQELAKHAPILMDRFYENTAATDGTDIGSRRKHRAYMKEHGLTTADDFKNTWSAAERERQAIVQGQADKRERREQIDRALWEINRP